MISRMSSFIRRECGVSYLILTIRWCRTVPRRTSGAVQLFERLRAIGFHTCLLSNNKEARVAPFAGQVDSDYIYKGRKPKRSGYRQAMRRMGTGERSTMFVGDQLFTDVYGARRTGIYSILVKPINPKEEIQIVLKRYLEKIVLWFYVRRQEKNSGSL